MVICQLLVNLLCSVLKLINYINFYRKISFYLIGYLKAFPSELVSGWSSGTGMAGMFGSGLLLVLKALNFPLTSIFFILIPI